MELTVFERPQPTPSGGGKIIYLYGPPDRVLQALWDGLEGGPNQRHYDRLGLLRTADGEACAEIEVPEGRSRRLFEKLRNMQGIQVLLTSTDGEELSH